MGEKKSSSFNADKFMDEFLEEEIRGVRELDVKDKFKPRKTKVPLPNLEIKDDESKKNDKSKPVIDESKPVIDEEDKEGEFNSLYDDGDLEDEDNDYYSEDEELLRIAQEVLDWEPPAAKTTPDSTLVNEWLTTGWVGMLHIDHILTKAIITGASDVHLTTGQTVSMSHNGEIEKYDEYVIPDDETMHALVHEGILNYQQQQEFNRAFEYDGAYTVRFGPYKGSRTRINIGKSFGNYFIVFRIINDYIPGLEELNIEQELVDWSYYPNGLFLLCGPTGTGKSTTLASIVHNLLLTTKKKVITIEKPIEYIYPDDTPSLVVQREVGGDTKGFYQGLTSAMRQNPDVILLGEVRNTEEVQELLRAAETGHLAISTMHTNSVATTLNRIQNLFSGNEQKRIMSTLADTLRGIGNQVLVIGVDGERFAVREILTINEEIREMIVKGDVRGIKDYQVKNKITMEHKLAEAVNDGKCVKEEALKQVVDIELFNSLIR